MPRETRGIFIRRQKGRLNRGLTDAEYIREWNQKSALEREQWVNIYKLLTDQGIAANIAQAAWDEALAEYLRVRDARDDPHLGHHFYPVHWRATRAATNAKQAFTVLRLRYQTFMVLEAQQPVPSNETLNRSLVKIAACDNKIAQFSNELRTLHESRHGPETPPDQNLERRMPEHWYTGHWEDLRQWKNMGTPGHLDDLGHGTVRLQQDNGWNWLPWVKLSDREAKGCLWLGFDHHHTIQERVFRKDIQMDEFRWTDPRCWEGDIRDPDQKTPYEISCNDALQQIPTPYVVQLREGVHRGLINNNRLQYKVYLTWCQHQDLTHLMREFRANNRDIPEPFIWHVAESMAMVGCTMETGVVPPNDDAARTVLPAEGWDSIVHRDIKPDNVFLGAVAGPLYPDYPTPVLGDWGLSFKTPLNDVNNPFLYKTGAGTPGFRAPEQMRWINQETLEPMLDTWKVDTKTDVFAVGMVLRCLVLGRQDHSQPWFLGNGNMSTELSMAVPPATMPPAIAVRVNRYSMELRILIDHCLSFDPAIRPHFDQMLTRIRTHTDEGGLNLGEGMRSGVADLATLHQQGVLPPQDTYAIGLSRDGPGAIPPAAL